MPAGGPYDLGSTAHDLGDTPDAQSVMDPLGVGMDAYRAGVARSECPYSTDSSEGDRWLEGWDHQKNAESDSDGAI